MNKKGFTLIELLVVIGILGILMGVVVVAVNPARQFAQARNAQRWSNVNTILNAVGQYYVDKGSLPTGIKDLPSGEVCKTTTVTAEICVKEGDESPAVDCTTPTAFIDLSDLSPNYIVDIPEDPTGAAANGAGYHIVKLAGDRVTVCAPDAELAEDIDVTR